MTDPEAEARALVSRLRRGVYRPAEGFLRGAPGAGDPGWAAPFGALLDQARRDAERGAARSAARIYAVLLPALLLDGVFGGCDDPRDLLAEPLPTHLLRYLQALAAQHRPAQAGHALVAALLQLAPLGVVAPIEALLRPLDAADRAALSQSLRAALLQAPTDNADWDRQRLALLQVLPPTAGELHQLRAAVDRAAGRLPELHIELVSALLRADQLHEALAAADRAQGVPPAVALRLLGLRAEVHDRRGEASAALNARRAAWEQAPDTARLLDLAAAHPEALPDLLSAAYGVVGDEALLARLELLTGEHETALARLQAAPVAAWEAEGHPYPIVLPFLLRLGLGSTPPPLGSVFTTIWPPEAPWTQAVETLLRRRPALSTDGPWFRAVAHAELLRCLDEGVVTGVIPDTLPRYCVAWAEVVAATGDREAALHFLDRIRRRHPRHRRFRASLEALGPRARV